MKQCFHLTVFHLLFIWKCFFLSRVMDLFVSDLFFAFVLSGKDAFTCHRNYHVLLPLGSVFSRAFYNLTENSFNNSFVPLSRILYKL